MKLVIQRVKKSSVSVDGQIVGQIEKGLCVLTGIAPTDTEKDLDWMAQKWWACVFLRMITPK